MHKTRGRGHYCKNGVFAHFVLGQIIRLVTLCSLPIFYSNFEVYVNSFTSTDRAICQRWPVVACGFLEELAC